ncbi:MAG: glycosyltransferase family 2 protein [Myxococcales bacterium]|jgi:glycosyltransferase involved in cell wall biosynthesis
MSGQQTGSQPLVSVVIPTFNRADILGRCLQALAKQTYRPFEVIVVDDCSRDETPQILSEFAAAHPDMRLRHVRNAEQSGANPSRNRAVAMSEGSLIAFEDDDCIADPNWLQALVAQFVSDEVGAVTGIVHDPQPRNIYDLAFRGTHRVYGKELASRLIAGNMCVRRQYLDGALDEDRAEVSEDNTVSGRGDEEGLFLRLRRAGKQVRIAHDATVLHEHYYTRSSFFRQALKGGRSAARLGHKYGLPLRPELLCLALGWASVPVAVVVPVAIVPGAICFSLFAGATLVYNEIWRKDKTPLQALKVAPVMTAYYHVRAFGYFRELLRLQLGRSELQRAAS